MDVFLSQAATVPGVRSETVVSRRQEAILSWTCFLGTEKYFQKIFRKYSLTSNWLELDHMVIPEPFTYLEKGLPQVD